MAQVTEKGFLLSDTEAAAVRRWVHRQPRARPLLMKGAESVAHLMGISRRHLSYAISPDAGKRVPIGRETLQALLRRLVLDNRAKYELRRVATDELQEAIDAAEFGAPLLRHGPGYIVAVVPI